MPKRKLEMPVVCQVIKMHLEVEVGGPGCYANSLIPLCVHNSSGLKDTVSSFKKMKRQITNRM